MMLFILLWQAVVQTLVVYLTGIKRQCAQLVLSRLIDAGIKEINAH